ncbi:Pkinase and Rhodanese and RabGAP-TBC domain conta ining protein [Trichuris trichiura]|uniref:Pkinase and Rhodanese and RabGAP-TBC domain conta ining protein n=1 Tax=Trichuris trichiura TaxID=36087 RepID=A0A077ZCR3_TRITR|nr:Pkinase and Rhodanese and RabGAP-TBC domain conta ining protein [Trichuris trichiura]
MHSEVLESKSEQLSRSFGAMRLLLDGHFGVSTLVSRLELATTEYGPNGLPLTPLSINIIGRFPTLKALSSPYLCAYLDIHRGKYERIFVISEHYSKTFYSLLEENIDARLDRFNRVAFSILCGLDYLHTRGIYHTFLAGETVLLSDDVSSARLLAYSFKIVQINPEHYWQLPISEFCVTPPVLLICRAVISNLKKASIHTHLPNVCLGNSETIKIRIVLLDGPWKGRTFGKKVTYSYRSLCLEMANCYRNDYYSAPEFYVNDYGKQCVGPKVDIWSLGILLLELLLVRSFDFTELSSRLVELWLGVIQREPVLLSVLSWLRKEQRLSQEVPSLNIPPWPSEFRMLISKCLQLKPSQSLVIGDLHLLGGLKNHRRVANLNIYSLSMKNLTEVLLLQSLPRLDRSVQSLPLLVKEKDVSYQVKRTALFRRLLAAYPYTREKLISEAVFDIPPIYRGLVWAAILDIPYNITDIYSVVDKATEAATDRQIEVDIPRCHQYDELLSSPTAHQKFKRIIKAWTAFHPEYVYWQGLDSLCAPFLYLHFNNECLAFGCLTAFINSFLKSFFLKDNSAVMRAEATELLLLYTEYLAVFENALAFYDCQLYNHFCKINFHPEVLQVLHHFFSHTVQSISAVRNTVVFDNVCPVCGSYLATLHIVDVMPLYKLFHVWDLLLVSGNCFPICIGVAILSQMRRLLLQSGFNECILLFSDIPEVNLENCLKEAVSAYRVIPKSLMYNRPLSAVLSNSASWIDDYVLKVGGELGMQMEQISKDEDRENGLFPEICADELIYYLDRPDANSGAFLLIDVRSEEEYARKTFPQSRNVPYTIVFKEGECVRFPPLLEELLSHDYRMIVVIGSSRDCRARKTYRVAAFQRYAVERIHAYKDGTKCQAALV